MHVLTSHFRWETAATRFYKLPTYSLADTFDNAYGTGTSSWENEQELRNKLYSDASRASYGTATLWQNYFSERAVEYHPLEVTFPLVSWVAPTPTGTS